MKTKLLKIINHYGIIHQQRKLQEEVFELQEAIIRYEDMLEANIVYGDDKFIIDEFKCSIEEEMSDVCNLLMEICNYYDLSIRNITKTMEYKLERQITRVENEGNN